MITKIDENINLKNPLNVLSIVRKINELIDYVNGTTDKKIFEDTERIIEGAKKIVEEDNLKEEIIGSMEAYEESAGITTPKNKIKSEQKLKWRVVRKGNKMVLKKS